MIKSILKKFPWLAPRIIEKDGLLVLDEEPITYSLKITKQGVICDGNYKAIAKQSLNRLSVSDIEKVITDSIEALNDLDLTGEALIAILFDDFLDEKELDVIFKEDGTFLKIKKLKHNQDKAIFLLCTYKFLRDWKYLNLDKKTLKKKLLEIYK